MKAFKNGDNSTLEMHTHFLLPCCPSLMSSPNLLFFSAPLSHSPILVPGGFSEAAASKDPQPCTVSEFPSLLARRIAYPRPHFVLFTADIDLETGKPWCPDCARMLDSARKRVKGSGGTLMEVQVTAVILVLQRSLLFRGAFACCGPFCIASKMHSMNI